jgi:hypothetical protein
MNAIELQDQSSDASLLAQSLAALERFEGVVELNPMAGQFLVYQEHVPRGVFLIVSGELGFHQGELAFGSESVSDSDPLCLTVPTVVELNTSMEYSVRMETNGRVLYIPRTVAFSEKEVIEILARPCFVEAKVSDG